MIANHAIRREREHAAVIGPDVAEIPGHARTPKARDAPARVAGADEEHQDRTVRGVLELLDVGKDSLNPGLNRRIRLGQVYGGRVRLIEAIPGQGPLLIMEVMAGERHLPDLVGAGGP